MCIRDSPMSARSNATPKNGAARSHLKSGPQEQASTMCPLCPCWAWLLLFKSYALNALLLADDSQKARTVLLTEVTVPRLVRGNIRGPPTVTVTVTATPILISPSFSTAAAPAPVRPLPPPSSFFACPSCHVCLDAKPLVIHFNSDSGSFTDDDCCLLVLIQ